MTIKGIKKLIQINNFSWLFHAAKPYLWTIVALSLFSIISAIAVVGSAVISKQMVDSAVSGYASKAFMFILLFVATHLVILFVGTLTARLSVELNEKISYRIEQNLLKKLYRSQWRDISQYHSGDILTRFTDDIANISNMWVSTIPGIFGLGIQLILALVILLFYDTLLALLAFVLGPVSILIGFLFGQRLKTLQHDIQTARSRHRSFVTELIQHMSVIKAFQYEEESLKQVIEKQNNKYSFVVKRNKLSILASIIMAGGYWIGYMLAFIYGVFKLADRTVSFGTFTAFLQLVGHIQQPFLGLARTVPQMISTLASVERLIELESLNAEKDYSGNAPGRVSEVGVVLNDVCFEYKPGEKILDHTSIKVTPGKIAALIGSSGEGKTTLMRLLLAFLQASAGSAYLDIEGKEEEVSPGSRSYFTYVPQGNTLFSGTIAYNLRVGKPDATDNELEAAVKTACAKEFIDELPDGMNTVVGEEGVGLSEGQAQRLCIARAILRPSPVLLLDEATSALDMETEKAIFENLRNLKRTCIVITHRLSVLPMCDAVFRIENGRIYEHGADDFLNILEKEKQG